MTWMIGHLAYRASCTIGNALFSYVACKENIKYELIGKENIPKHGESAILYINHTKPLKYNLFGIEFKFDSIDHLVIGFKTHEDIHFVELDKFSKGWVGVYNRTIENIPISSNPRVYKESKRLAEKLLSHGKIVGVFHNRANSDTKDSRLAAKYALENNVNFIKVDLNLIGRNGKYPQTLVSPETAAVQVIYHPAINISELKRKNPGKSRRELEEMLTNC